MTRAFPGLPEDVPQVAGLLSEDMPRPEHPRTAYHRAYYRKYRYLINVQRRALKREHRAGLRPGGGCVKCELMLGCGGLFCDRAERERPG